VREVAAARRTGEAREDARRALVEALAAVYPREVFGDPKTWSRARRLDGISVAMVGDDTTMLKGSERPTAYLFNQLAAYRLKALVLLSHKIRHRVIVYRTTARCGI